MADDWNRFVAQSKNGTFLFDRRYMDYHADRFVDHSLMVYRRGRLYALLPANEKDQVLFSHQGLTYGGLVMNERVTAADVVSIFRLINSALRDEGFLRVVYKPVPWIYHRQPSEEDLYAIVEACHAQIVARGLSSTITAIRPNKWYRIRETGAVKAARTGVSIGEEEDFAPFWQVLTENLNARYGLQPVHSLAEIEMLHLRFPDHIRLVTAKADGETVAGVVLYQTDRLVHSQYIAASTRGKSLHALDLLFRHVINESLQSHAFFDFGISTEEHGTYLNEQLIYQKEGFGGRGICYDWYEWTL